MFAALLIAVFFLAYSNGSNDNFKGVATLFGSRTANYRTALWWGSGATFLGSIVSIFFSKSLILRFSGQDFVPATIAQAPAFVLSIAMAAALTVILATRLGFPISTTHSLVGALMGAGLMAARSEVGFASLARLTVFPLLLSPVIAIVLCYSLYALTCRAPRLGTDEVCVCVEQPDRAVMVAAASSAIVETNRADSTGSANKVAQTTQCVESRYWSLVNFSSVAICDCTHYLSAGLVSFARGLNDTPKIAALLALTSLPLPHVFVGVALAVMFGGLLSARRVATVMSDRIVPLTHTEGFSANLVTGILVVAASKVGVPVSTTHVSVGALFGMGVANGLLNKQTLTQILFAWILTLPLAAACAAFLYQLLR
jgi:PiT family inorganic phosphate transporter